MKEFYALFRQSTKAIFANKGRSFLTMLGIIIGIGSVIALTSMGEGANRLISEQINELGTTNLTIIPGGGLNPSEGGGFGGPGGEGFNQGSISSLSFADLIMLSDKNTNPNIEKISGVIISSGVVKNGTAERRATINGVSRDYFDINKLNTSSGGVFSAEADTKREKVVILGSRIAESLFFSSEELGEDININQTNFSVVGVLPSSEEGSINNVDSQIFIPINTASEILNTQSLSNIMVQVVSEDKINEAKDQIEKNLIASHNISDPKLADFSIISPQDLLSAVNQITGLLTSLLAGIAAISLVVGGIGIMNIMLVAVTERTREIGLRKAVGAKTSDILIQFLIEAVILTVLGGLLGIALGYGIGRGFAAFTELDPVITLGSLLLAVGVSSAVGLLFGIYPAYKAAKLNPIDALRYE